MPINADLFQFAVESSVQVIKVFSNLAVLYLSLMSAMRLQIKQIMLSGWVQLDEINDEYQP